MWLLRQTGWESSETLWMSRHPCTGPGARSSQLPASPPVVTTSTPVATDPSLASGSCRPNSVGNPRKHGSCPKLPGRYLRIVEGLLTAVVYLLSINKSNKWIKHSIRSRTPRPSNTIQHQGGCFDITPPHNDRHGPCPHHRTWPLCLFTGWRRLAHLHGLRDSRTRRQILGYLHRHRRKRGTQHHHQKDCVYRRRSLISGSMTTSSSPRPMRSRAKHTFRQPTRRSSRLSSTTKKSSRTTASAFPPPGRTLRQRSPNFAPRVSPHWNLRGRKRGQRACHWSAWQVPTYSAKTPPGSKSSTRVAQNSRIHSSPTRCRRR